MVDLRARRDEVSAEGEDDTLEDIFVECYTRLIRYDDF